MTSENSDSKNAQNAEQPRSPLDNVRLDVRYEDGKPESTITNLWCRACRKVNSHILYWSPFGRDGNDQELIAECLKCQSTRYPVVQIDQALLPAKITHIRLFPIGPKTFEEVQCSENPTLP